jgi:carbamoyl-phosphate synthase large subunit
MNILITSAGRRVSLVKAFQKELKKIFPKGQVMTTDFNVKLSAACQVSDQAFQTPPVSDVSYFETLHSICQTHNIKMLIPTIDTELLLLAKNKDFLLEHGILAVVSSETFVSMCRNKRDTHQFFKKHGIQVAKEYSKQAYTFPLFIKPLHGSRSKSTYLIQNEDALSVFSF